MSETLLIHYNINKANQATWALSNDAGEITGKITTGAINEISELAAAHPVVIILNSQCLHISQLQLPTQNMQKMLKAVPYALEEFIADDIENFHFVIARNKHDKSISVVGIDKNTLQNIVQIFQNANIAIKKIIPDALCLAADAETRQWACLSFHENSILQTETLNGMTLPDDLLEYVITNKLQDKDLEKPEKILFFSERESTAIADKFKFDDENIDIINVIYNTHPLVVFCGHYKQAIALNLLQHEFKPKNKSSVQWQYWRMAAALAIIWLVLHLGITGFQYSRTADENKILKAKIEKIYKKAFPESRKIINPRSQMAQKLKQLKGTAGGANNGLIYLLAESFGHIKNKQEGVNINSMTFRNNRMDIGLDSTNLQTLETFNQSLNNNKNIKSEIVSSSAEKNKVKGNLRVEWRN